MSSWWVANLWQQNPAYLVAHVVVVIMAVVLHELAHGFVAIKVGDDTPIKTGHMTLNPWVHMGGFGLILFALTGFIFGAMPVSPWRFRGRYAGALVAFAGPATNLVLGVVFAAGLALWWRFADGRVHEPLYTNVEYFLHIGTLLNFVLLVFNLVPVPPLDGATVLGGFVKPLRSIFENPSNRMLFNIAFIVLLMRGSSYVWDAAFEVGGTVVRFFLGLLPGA